MSSPPALCEPRSLLGRPAPLRCMHAEAGRMDTRQAPRSAACARRGHTRTRQVGEDRSFHVEQHPLRAVLIQETLVFQGICPDETTFTNL